MIHMVNLHIPAKGKFTPDIVDESLKDIKKFLKEYYPDYGGGALEDTVGSLATSSDKKIIKTVRETVETENYDKFIDDLRSAVTSAGGYIASSHYYGGGIYDSRANRSASFEIRIPADALENFNGSVGGFGAVTYYEESANDVTLSYVDITSKIAVLEAEEAALLSILSRAETTADILSVRSSLASVQSDLASLRAQKTVIDDKVAYSTVNMTLREVKRVTTTDQSFLEEVGEEFSDSLEDIGEDLRAFFVWLIGDSLYILLVCPIAVGVFFILRAIVRRIRATRVKKTAKNDSEK